MPGGRPCTFKPETGEEICKRLARGESLNAICKDKHMPDRDTVMDWVFKLPEFGGKYARAREMQAEKWADDIVDIADNSKDSNLGRLQVDARKWVVSKLLPKKYGDRLALGGDAATGPVKLEVTWKSGES